MNNIIYNIINGIEIDDIFQYAINHLYRYGPVSTTILEILSYLSVYSPEKFSQYSNQILKYMGVNYKKTINKSLKDVVFGMYAKHIKEKYDYSYTPVQASIVDGIQNNMCFSFSAPTSTGKSFVFRNIINDSMHDIVIIVPSRALINEYFTRLKEEITDKKINILTFIDKINTKNSIRNIFIVTPERCKEIFKHKNDFHIDYFLFDEAQLSDEDSNRGIFFDSIIRRLQKAYPDAQFVFAHPFVANPEAQIIKNHFDVEKSYSFQYIQKNVGQMFFVQDDNKYYHFGIDKNIMGKQRIVCNFDPIEKAIKSNGSVLVYTTKTSIYKKSVFNQFKKYIDMCEIIHNKEAEKIIAEIKSFVGASINRDKEKFSQMVYLLKRGIVVHHGSLPLQARLLLERFTQLGYCRICFATSTLEQGINMPFEVVYLNTFHASKPLSMKNLIGRAGRSSVEQKFDYGSIVIKKDNMSTFRDILKADDILKTVSLLEDDNIADDFKEFRDAILGDTFSDEYNLTLNQLEKLSSQKTMAVISTILDSMFFDNHLISLGEICKDSEHQLAFYKQFEVLYSDYLGRELVRGEKNVFDTAIRILLWKVHCKTFKEICYYRYAHASKLEKRKELKALIENSTGTSKKIYTQQLDSLYASFVTECAEIPNKQLKAYSMFGNKEVKARAVDYDRIVFDTYDYLDKLVGFQLSDIFFAAFHNYFLQTQDVRAEKFSKYVKYGTDDVSEIWMLRYGLTFEDIEWAKNYIISIDEKEIQFKPTVLEIEQDKLDVLSRFIND